MQSALQYPVMMKHYWYAIQCAREKNPGGARREQQIARLSPQIRRGRLRSRWRVRWRSAATSTWLCLAMRQRRQQHQSMSPSTLMSVVMITMPFGTAVRTLPPPAKSTAETCATSFELYANSDCGEGDKLATLHLADVPACCAACGQTPKCLAWTWKNNTDDQGKAHPQCTLQTNPGTFSPGSESGSTCGIYRDTPPGSECTACMKIYPNKTVSTSGDSYLRLQVNTSDECCGRCTADAGRCISWQWSQLQSLELRQPNTRSSSQDMDDWINCQLFQGDVMNWQNVSDGRPMMTGVMIGARTGYNPPPSPPPMDKDGYLGCFVDLQHGARRDLPFFFCSNQSDPTPMSGINYCADDPRLPPVLPSTPILDTASSWAGARRMSPALCNMLCADFDFFGVQNGSMCFCGVHSDHDGPGYGNFGRAPESECSAQCTDPHASSTGARCGGMERNSIYKVLDSPPPPLPSESLFSYVGCFPDQQESYHQMPALPTFYCPNAQQHCPGEANGFDGIASDCLGSELELPAPQCSGEMDQEHCGRLPNTKSDSGRAGRFMTLELCDALCTGFEYFAVQSGQFCNCGQAYGTQGNTSQESWCNQKCSGNKSQTCGGNRRGFQSASSVYRRQVPSRLRRRGHGSGISEPPPLVSANQTSNAASSPAFSGANMFGDPHPHCHLIPACQPPNASVDWSSHGVVVDTVPDQGTCNASWAFAAAASVESASAIVTGRLLPLSAQGIVDCAWQYGGQSCKGGEVNRGLMHAQNVGLCTEQSYPFTGDNAACCRGNCEVAVPGQEDGGVQGFCNVPGGSESALMSALNQQPVAVGLALPPGFLSSYKGGVFLQDYKGRMNEAGLAVGYGTVNGQAYWKVKLFRGASFGENGYVLLARGSNTGPLGQCSILSAPSYPVVTKPTKTYPKPGNRNRHYGPLPCLEGEEAVHVPGTTSGTVCASRCTAGGSCPASGSCDLTDPKTKQMYCTLQCQSDCDCPSPLRCVMSVYLANPTCMTVSVWSNVNATTMD